MPAMLLAIRSANPVVKHCLAVRATGLQIIKRIKKVHHWQIYTYSMNLPI